jgi:hypothetical protein
MRAFVGRAFTFVTFTSLLGLVACDDPVTVTEVNYKYAVDPLRIDFGNVQIGTSATREFFIRNSGDPGAQFSVALERGQAFDDAFSFAIDRADINSGGVSRVTVTFQPTETGDRAGKLRVLPNTDKLTANEVEIVGVGVSTTLIAEPLLLNFGNVVVGTTETLQVELRNESSVEATIEYSDQNDSNVKLCAAGGSDPSVFCVTSRERPIGPDRKFTIPAGATTKIDVSFEPTIAGTRENGSFVLKACPLPACDITITVDGLGIESGFRCTPPSIDFGFINPGSCASRTVSCENIANEQVTVVSWETTNRVGTGPAPEFVPETPMVQVLNEGETVDVDTTYCPTEVGNDEAVLSIETNNADPRLRFFSVQLEGSGGGPDIDVTPLTVNFGLVSLIAPARRTVTIQNVGYDVLNITGIEADSANTGAFELQDQTPTSATIPVGGFLDIPVEFQPVAAGPTTTDLVISSDDQDENPIRVTLIGEGINLPPCSFQVLPGQLAFGVVARTRTLVRSFEIQNTGANDCLVTSARLVGSDPEFSLIDGDVMSRIIPRDSSMTVAVQFAPVNAGDSQGQVEFSISSPSSPFNTVQLSGTGADETLLIVPNDLDYGVIGVGCNARARTVTVYNTGSTPAQITSIALQVPVNPAFTLNSVPGLPVTLQPGGSTAFDVGFRADAISSYAGAVEMVATFNSQQQTYVIGLLGRGDLDATQVDNFEQLGKPKVDILWVIDNSGSMGEEQASLAMNFQAFIEFAEAQEIDYQIAVTTTDVDSGGEQGRFVPIGGNNRIVTPQTQPSPNAVFGQNSNVGTIGSAFEQGLEAAYMALSPPAINADNMGFLRTDAVLSIIFVSDEVDQSPQTVDFYTNFFLSIKGFRNTNLFSASSIVGDTPGGCTGPGGNADDGARYVEVSRRTGGIFQSICTTDWSRALEELSSTAFGFKSRFFLSNQPVISTVEVYIDGVMLEGQDPSGQVNWTYDYSTNSVNFSPIATPEPGAEIRVEYTVECL